MVDPASSHSTGRTVTGRWLTEQNREARAITAFVWTQRPSAFRWPVTVAALALALLGARLAMKNEALGWVLLVLAALLAVLIVLSQTVLRPLLKRSVLNVMLSDGSEVTVAFDEIAWSSSGGGRETRREWTDLDGWAIAGDDLVLIKRATGRWIPAVIGLIPLDAFGGDREQALGLVQQRLPQIGPLNALGLRPRRISER
jgi:hypothetical protein